MARALFNDTVIAEADETIVVEGNHYFPPDSIRAEYFSETPSFNTTCPWKGVASYYDVEVEGERAPAVAWTYRDPSDAAAGIKDHVAFYPKVRVEVSEKPGFFRRR